jgi:hypothetical protein
MENNLMEITTKRVGQRTGTFKSNASGSYQKLVKSHSMAVKRRQNAIDGTKLSHQRALRKCMTDLLKEELNV